MILELEALSHRYGSELAVDDLSVGVEAGELVALLGPSGCGKTTIVQCIAGHVRPTGGQVLLRGEAVTDRPPETRRVGVVFQQSTLFPHMTVRENVAYGLAPQELTRPDERVEAYLDLVAMHDQRAAYPGELSGGQRRRAELARALAPRPDVLLLDEPLSALDRTLREQLRDEIARIQRETGVTTLFVTHDQEDAMALADRLVVMAEGRVAGAGDPRTLYQSPPNPFVASFLGRSNTLSATVVDGQPPAIALDGQTAVLDGVVTQADDRAAAENGDGVVTQADDRAAAENGDGPSTVTCHIRPEDVTLGSPDADGTALTLPGEVTRVSDAGRRYDVTVRVETGEELLAVQSADPPAAGEAVTVELPLAQLTVF